MTPIGSTSSNIRRAIEFMVDPSFRNLAAPSGLSRSVGRLRTAKLIAQRSRIAAWGAARNVPVGTYHQPLVGILAGVVYDVLRCWPVTHRSRTTSPDVRRIGYRRVKVRWVTPLGDETASM